MFGSGVRDFYVGCSSYSYSRSQHLLSESDLELVAEFDCKHPTRDRPDHGLELEAAMLIAEVC